jgi:hypothetical protein
MLKEPLLGAKITADYMRASPNDSDDDHGRTNGDDKDDTPHSRMILAKLKPTGRVAIDGLAAKYADTYTLPLQKFMSEEEFRAAMGAINQTLGDFFPCLTCVVYAYIGYVVTCGSFLCCARPCTHEVRI